MGWFKNGEKHMTFEESKKISDEKTKEGEVAVSCYECRCLIKKMDVKTVRSIHVFPGCMTYISDDDGYEYEYCHGCKPDYDYIVGDRVDGVDIIKKYRRSYLHGYRMLQTLEEVKDDPIKHVPC